MCSFSGNTLPSHEPVSSQSAGGRFYQAVLNSLSAHVAVIDQDGRILVVNRAWERFAQDNGASPASVSIGANYLDVCRGAGPCEEGRAVLAGIAEVLAGRRAEFTLEYPCHSPTEQRWFQLHVTPLPIAMGGAVIAHVNITQRKQAELYQARLVSILEATPDFILTSDSQGRLCYLNQAGRALLGIPPAENLAGMHLRDLYAKTAQGQLADLLLSVAREGTWQGETDLLCRDGKPVPVSMVVISHPDPEGQGALISTLARDISERKRAEADIRALNEGLERRVAERTAQLTAINHELEAFSYSVSHDLRAPFRHIVGFASLLRQRAEGALDETSRRYLTTIMNAARHAGLLVDMLLELSRIGRASLMRQGVDMGRLTQDALAGLSQDLAGRQVVLDIGPLPEVEGDPLMLRQVMANLLGNAVKYTAPREEARITVRHQLSEDGKEHIFSVGDNGVGFDMKYAGKLFGVFQRLHREEEFPGTGIGLALVRRIVLRHGGRTWAQGRPGEGATFHFALPR